MKKILLLIMAVLLIGSFAYSQDSNVETLTLSATLESGSIITLTNLTASWASIPVPTTNFETEWIECDEGVNTLDVYGRFTSGIDGSHRGELLIETIDFALNGIPSPSVANELVKFVFTGDIELEQMASGGGIRSVWTSPSSTFHVAPSISIQFANTLTRWPGIYTGVFTFVIMDRII